jgi:lipopolysaccharide export system protein LptA
VRVWATSISLGKGTNILLLLLALLCVQAATAQECESNLVDFQGAIGRSTVQNGQEVFELTGPILLQCGTELIARTGTQEAVNQYRFEGDVRIVERGDTVYADNVLYFSDSKIGQANGNVVITDGVVTLLAPEAIYFTNEQRTVFNNGVQFEDSTSILTSRRGTYWSDEARAEFNSDVELHQDSLYVSADSLTYWRESEETNARGNVYVERSDGELVTIFGRSLFHSAAIDSSHISGNVDMLQVTSDSTGTDSLFVRSAHLFLTRSEASEFVLATDSVEVIQGKISVIGDTLAYTRFDDGRSELTRTFGAPVAWLDLSQISSDNLWLTRRDGQLDSLRAEGDVFVAQFDTVLTRIQQLKGRTLVGLFVNDSLRTMTVAPNAEALYYVEASEEGEQAATRTSSDSIVFSFRGGELVKIGSYDALDGEYYPSNIIDQAENLTGYSWTPERRPEKETFRAEWLARVERRIGRRIERTNESTSERR